MSLMEPRDNVKLVESFFDHHSEDYAGKYKGANAFYKYFFYERLKKATSEYDFKNKRILDVGSGTGALYDYLRIQKADFKIFKATDLSEGMLAKSKVPEEDKLIGDILDLRFEKSSFDFVFMLGVSTYIDPNRLKEQLANLSELLDETGVLILTYTNAISLDIMVRRIILPFGKIFASKSRVISQEFKTWYHSKKSFFELMPSSFYVEKSIGLNHTFFPFSRLFPKVSIRIAKMISRWKSTNLKSFLSSDILLFIHKSEPLDE